MNLVAFSAAPEPDLARALAEFEKRFVYPLGPGRTFRIEHAADYARFYRAQGEARCFARVEAGHVLGVFCIALRPLILPSGRCLSRRPPRRPSALTGYSIGRRVCRR